MGASEVLAPISSTNTSLEKLLRALVDLRRSTGALARNERASSASQPSVALYGREAHAEKASHVSLRDTTFGGLHYRLAQIF
jgi:hypothetical protein